MVDTQHLREAFARTFDRVEELGEDLVRGERHFEGKPFAVAYMDLSDTIVKRSESLTQFQEQLLGSKYFGVDSILRWNSYLYLWAGPESIRHEAFATAKARIERDRHYARKFVVTQADLANRLTVPSLLPPSAETGRDVSSTWGDMLRTASLGVLLEQRPRTQALELIASGEAFVADTTSVARVVAPRQDPLQTGVLRSLDISTFRPINSGRTFQFGDVTLIFGPNGSGKTSLLEGIEALYCGRIRRDPDATFGTIRAQVLTPTSGLVPVLSTNDVSVLKARNQSWYGRSDPQSHAILQGFSRFNFLDTDAAFRLSSSTDNEQIKLDLSRLLVGPEASKLWTYLTKLEEESRGKQNDLDGRRALLRTQGDLLASEVDRIRNAPTESNTLARTYRSRLTALGAQWPVGDDGSPLNPSDRNRLELLSRGLGQILSMVQVTPVTRASLKQRAVSLAGTLVDARALADEYSTAVQRLGECDAQLQKETADLHAIETWAKFCEAGAPVLAESLKGTESDAASLRTKLKGYTIEAVGDLPAEYATQPPSGALDLARKSLQAAEQHEQAAATHLQQSERLGQSITSLRKDLHDIATTLIQRTGDSLYCPVCRTQHTSVELLNKIELLVASQDSEGTEGLRSALQRAKEKTSSDRRVLSSLTILEDYRNASAHPISATATWIRDDLMSAQQRLASLTDELQRIHSATSALYRFGIEWRQYEAVRLAAVNAMGTDTTDLAEVTRLGAAVGARAADAQRIGSELRTTLAELSRRAAGLIQSLQVGASAGASPQDAVMTVERAQAQVIAALTASEHASEELEIDEAQSLESLQRDIDDCIRVLDRALHAERSEAQSRVELQRKTVELEGIHKEIHAVENTRGNYARAVDVLSSVIRQHSLDKATSEALALIRKRVSDVFARIHAPAEYALGSFESDVQLVTMEGARPRRVSQVSTGQRSALALSIFLALNGSAASAPPVLLIDDPIAHIDDLNALSFLDYLRDLVLGTKRQVFFATADARLAALFERKFEFLGSERFRTILLAR